MEGIHGGFHWIPDDRDVWTVGRFVSDDGKNCKFVKPDGKEVVKAAKIETFEPVLQDQLEGKPDICQVQKVTKASLLHTVRTRYYKDEIYTNVSRIVIAINPCKAMPIYGYRFIEQYISEEPENLPPHVYGIAAEALRNLREDNSKSQAILISGESGAGKTESTKLVLSFVADALRTNESGDDRNQEESVETGIEEKVLMTSPVLEAFGNAKTVRNNNSSRFGKWLEIAFTRTALGATQVSGARIKDYLLETPRVTKIARNERNYHIFYHLFHHYSENFGRPSDFTYLKDGAAFDANSSNCTQEDYREVWRAMDSFGFTQKEKEEIFDVVAALLHIGDITFIPSPNKGCEGSVIQNVEALEEGARLLGVRPEVLAKAMLERHILVNRERTIVFRTPAKAASAKDALARLLYGSLFKWIVYRMNTTLGLEGRPAPPPGASLAFLGVLDIAGFETFEVNSLEQLFINLSNEELQHYFNQSVFMEETKEYEKEGITVNTPDFSAVDNSAVVQLISGKNGLLPMLDDEVGMPNSTNMTYISKVKKAHATSSRLLVSKFSNSTNFRVIHFAGQVEYNSDAWLEKNDDNPPMEAMDLMSRSELTVIKSIFLQVKKDADTDKHKPGARAVIRKKTVATKFVVSLRALLQKVSNCTPHFIRCIKPNHMNKPQVFDAPMVMGQLNFSGVLEAIKIRQMGYPLRMAFADFSLRFACVVPLKERTALRKARGSENFATVEAMQALLEALTKELKGKSDVSDFACGHSKVFVKGRSLMVLEEKRRFVIAEAAVTVSSWGRGCVLKMRLKRHLKLVKEIQNAVDELPKRPCETVEDFEKHQKELEGLLLEVPESVEFVGYGARPNFPSSSTVQKTLHSAQVLARKFGNQADTWRKMENSELIESFDVMEITKMLVRANDLELYTYPMCSEMLKVLEDRCQRLKKELPLLHALELALDEKSEGLNQWKAVLLMIEEAEMVEKVWLNARGHEMTAELRQLVAQAEEKEKIRRATVVAAKLQNEPMEEVETSDDEKGKDYVFEAIDQHAQELLLSELEKAIENLDSSALEALLGDAVALGLSSKTKFIEATTIFEGLQSEEYPLSVLKEELERKDEPKPKGRMQRLINLKERLDQLGCQQEAREVAKLMQRGVSRLTKHGLTMADKVEEASLAMVAFEDIRNFPRMLDTRTKLCWSREKLTRPLTDMPQRLQREALWMFSDILGWMKDRRAEKATHQALAYDIVAVALKDQYLSDETYIQVIKQLTDNPSEWSEHWGWKLMLLLCMQVTPSDELVEFIRYVLRKKVIPAHYGIQKLCLNEINSRLVMRRQTEVATGRECDITVHLMNGQSVEISGNYGTLIEAIKAQACDHFQLPVDEYALFMGGSQKNGLWRLLPDHEPIRPFIDFKLTMRRLSLRREEPLPEGLHGELSILQARDFVLFGSDNERVGCKSAEDIPKRMRHRASIKPDLTTGKNNNIPALEYEELQRNHWFGSMLWPAEVVTLNADNRPMIDAMPMPDAAQAVCSFKMSKVWVAASYDGVGFIPVGTSSSGQDPITWFSYKDQVLRWGAKEDIFQIVIKISGGILYHDKCVSVCVQSPLALEIAYGLTRVCTAGKGAENDEENDDADEKYVLKDEVVAEGA